MNDTLHDVARWADRGDRIAIAMVGGARVRLHAHSGDLGY
jgi:hypothetical protein